VSHPLNQSNASDSPRRRPAIRHALRANRGAFWALTRQVDSRVSAEHIAGRGYPLRCSGGATRPLGGRQRGRFPQERRFRVESGALAHVRRGRCTEVDTPFGTYACLISAHSAGSGRRPGTARLPETPCWRTTARASTNFPTRSGEAQPRRSPPCPSPAPQSPACPTQGSSPTPCAAWGRGIG